MAIVNAQLTTTQLDMITVPASKSYAITNIMVCNNGSFVPQSSSLSNSVTRVINNLELPVGETFTFDSERIVLEVGDKLSFVAEPDAGAGLTALSATVSYLEV